MKTTLFFLCLLTVFAVGAQPAPNVIIICADDLGYGDLSCYGADKITTPAIDRLAASGIRFTNGHSTSATCTPSRYAMMTGIYPWRRKGTGILPGDAALVVPVDKISLPALFKSAGYETGIVGNGTLAWGKRYPKTGMRLSRKARTTWGLTIHSSSPQRPTAFLQYSWKTSW